jgi:hypothetical protein
MIFNGLLLHFNLMSLVVDDIWENCKEGVEGVFVPEINILKATGFVR